MAPAHQRIPAEPIREGSSTGPTRAVFHQVKGDTKHAALREVVELMPFPNGADREAFLRVLLAREELGSTAMGEGVAIPHVRNPVVLRVDQPMVTLCFLETPIDFGALDHKPVHALFSMVSPSIRIHLHLLARLGFVLKDKAFKKLIDRKASAAEILGAVRAMESGM